MKNILLILGMISLLLFSSCKKSDESPEESSNVIITSGLASVAQTSIPDWTCSIRFKARNASKIDAYIFKVEYRLLLNEVPIATFNNGTLTPAILPGLLNYYFSSDTNLHLSPVGESETSFSGNGNGKFLNGQKPEKVEITAYIRNGTTIGDWDYTTKITLAMTGL